MWGNTPEAATAGMSRPGAGQIINSYANSATSITWEAAQGVDAVGVPVVKYEFSGAGINSGFQDAKVFTANNLQPNTAYTVQVRLQDVRGSGWEGPPSSGSGAPYARTTLAKAANVKAVGGFADQDGFFNDIGWDPTKAAQVRIFCVTTNQNIFTGAGSTFRHKGLVNGAPYIYKVFPINVDGIESSEYALAIGRPERKTSPKDYRIKTYDMEFNVSTPIQTLQNLPAYPTWSPDGKKIAFTKVQADNVGDLTVMSVQRPELPVKETVNNAVTTTIMSSDGKVKLEIPPLAVPSSGYVVTITPIITLDDQLLKSIVSAGINVTFAYELRKFDPQGNLDERPFDRPVTLTMAYDDAGLTSADEDNLHIFTYNRSKGLWEPIFSEFRTVVKQQNTISGTIEHFSVFAAIVDDVPPDPPVLDQTRTPTNRSVITLTGVAEPLTEVTLFKGGDKFETTTAQSITGRFEFSKVPVVVGDNLFSANALDGGGNVSALSNTLKVIGDFVGPQLAEGPAETFILDLQDRTRFEYTLSENGVITILFFTADGKVVRTVRQEVTGGIPASFSWDARGDAGKVVEEGEYKYLIAGADLAGNPADRFLEGGIVFDTSVPVADFVFPRADSVVGRTVVVRGTAFDFNFDHFDLWFSDNAEMRDSTLLNHATSPVRDGQLGVWNAGMLKDGRYYLSMTIGDRLGRGASKTIPVTVDNTPPTLTLTSPQSGDVFRFDQDPQFVGTVLDAHLKHYYAEYLNSLNPQQWIRFPDTGAEPRTASPLVTVTGLSDGVYDLRIRALDQAGNISEQIVPSITIDRGIRELAISSPAEGAALAGFVEVAGTIKDQNLNHYELRLGRGDSPTQWIPLASAGKERDNEFLVGFASGEHPDGVYTLSLIADDLLGNQEETRRVIEIDNSAPLVAVTYPESNSAISGFVHFRGTVLDNHLAKYRLEYREASRTGSVWRPLGSEQFVAVTNGLLVPEKLATILLNDGPIVARITAEDRAGNLTIKEDTYMVDNVQIDIQTFDAQPDIISPNADRINDTSSVVVGVPIVAGSTIFSNIQVLDASGAVVKSIASGEAARSGPNAYTWDGTDAVGQKVSDGLYQITAEIFDNRSNRSRKLTKEVAVDTRIDTVNIRRILVVNGPGNVSQYKLGAGDVAAEHALVEAASGLLNIEGVAADGNFLEWNLFHRVAGHERVKFLTGAVGISAGQIGSLDVNSFGADEVTLILQVKDSGGNIAEDTATVRLDLQSPAVTISSPGVREIVGGQLTVRGTIFDANLREYSATITGVTDPTFSKVLAVGSTAVSDGVIADVPVDFTDGVYELSVRATDKASRVTTVLREFQIDRTAPVTEVSISNVLQAGDPVVVDYTSVFTLTAKDNVSGVSKTEFKTGAGDFVEGTQFNITKSGLQTVSFRSTDRAGKVEAPKTVQVSVNAPAPEDGAAPVTKIAFDPPAFGGVQGQTISPSTRVGLSASDDISGVLLTEFAVDEGLSAKYTDTFQIASAGAHRIRFRSVDLANNFEVEQGVSVIVDAAPPATALALGDVHHLFAEGVLYLAPGHQLAFKALDDVSGVRVTEYRIGSGEFQTTNPFQIAQNGLVNLQFRSVDNVSNAEAHKNQTVFVDDKPPVTSIFIDGVLTPGQAVAASKSTKFGLAAVDAGAGVDTVFYSINQSVPRPYTTEFQITEDGNHTVAFFTVDRLGNQESEKKIAVTIDNAAPVSTPALEGPQVVADKTYVTSNTLVNIVAQDAVSRVARIEYRVGSAPAFSLFNAAFSLATSGLNKIEFRSADVLENVEPVKSVEVFVDNDGPRVAGIQTAYIVSSGRTLSITADIGDGGSGVERAVLKYFDPAGGARTAEIVSGVASVPFGAKEVGSFQFFVEATDKLGNVTRVPADRTYTIRVVDDVAPSLTIAPVVSPTKDAVNLAIQISDNVSDAEKILVTGNASPYEQEGNYAVEVTALDEAGNRTAKQTAFIIDRTGPAIDVSSPQVDQVVVGGRDTLKVIFGVADRFDPQPVVKASVRHVSSGTVLPVQLEQTLNLSSIPEGAWELTVEATDWLGNASTAVRKFTLSVDRTPPVIVIDPAASPTNQDVFIDFSVGDDFTPPDRIAISVLGDRPPYRTDGIYTVVLVATDESGNRAEDTVTFQIDKTAPVTTNDFKAPAKGWNNAPVTVKLTAVDPAVPPDMSFTGVDYTQFDVQGPSPQSGRGTEIGLAANGIHHVSYYSVDKVGNQEVARTIEVKVDRVAPSLSITSPSPGFVTKGAVGVTYQTSDDFTPLQDVVVTGRTAFDEEGAHTAVLRAEDLAGNVREASVSFIIDRTPPFLTINPVASPTNQNVVIAYSANDNFTAENEIVVLGQREFTQEGSHTATLTATDKGGNSTTTSVSFVIDRTKPTIKIRPVSTPRRDNVQLTLDVLSDDVSPSEKLQVTGQTAFEAEGTFSPVLTARDEAGNAASDQITFMIDKTPPVTTVSLNPPLNPKGWTTSDVVATLSAVDPPLADGSGAGSGVKETRYTLNGGPSTLSTTTNVAGEGIHRLYYYSTDNVGNVEATKDAFIRIDRTAPVFDTFFPRGGETFIAKKDFFVIKAGAKDNLDEFPGIFIQLIKSTGDKVITVLDGQKIEPLSIPSGKWKLYASATDAAGKQSQITTGEFTIIHDIQPPRTSLTVGDLKFVAADGATYVTAMTSLNLSAADDLVEVGDSIGLGVAKIEVRADNGGLVTVTNPVSLGGLGVNSEGKHTLSFFATDVLGNPEKQNDVTLYIDLTAPVTDSSHNPPANGNGWNNVDVAVSLSAVDPILKDGLRAGSGVKETKLGVDGATPSVGTKTTLTTQAVHTVDFYSVDRMNNTEATKQTTVRVDKTAPGISGSQAPPSNLNGWNNTPVGIQFTVSDDFSGVDELIGGFAADTLTGEGFGQSVTRSVTDKAGNRTETTYAGVDIDSTAPVMDSTALPPANVHGWRNMAVTVTFAETDALSGIDTPAVDVTLNAEGYGQNVTGFSVDLAGNTTTVTDEGIHIDLTVPILTMVSRLPAANQNGWNNSTVTVTYSETDALSGIDPALSDFAADVFPNEETGAIAAAIVVDMAGNTTTVSVPDIRIDLTNPLISISSVTPGTGMGPDLRTWWNVPVTVTYSISDTWSGVDYAVGGFENDVLPNEGENLDTHGDVTDNAGNSSSVTKTGINIDLTDPFTSITVGAPRVFDPTETYVTSATQFTLTAQDTLSGVAKTEYRIDGAGTFTPYSPFTLSATEGNRTIGFKSTDYAANEESERTVVLIVDNTAPTTTFSVDMKDTGGAVFIPESLITLTAVDGGAKPVGVATIEYRFDNGTFVQVSTSSSTTFGVDNLSLGAHTLEFRAIDRLGTEESFTTFPFTISPAIEASKFESFAPRVLVWINDKEHHDGDEDDGDADENEADTFPAENIAVIKSILDSAAILLYDIVEHPDTFVAMMRTDSYNLYLIVGDKDHLDEKEEWELSERVRMGDGLISSFFEKIYKPVHDKGEHEGQDDDEKGKGKGKDDDGDDQSKQTKASKNLLGVEVNGKHGDENLNIAFTGSTPVTAGMAGYQTVDKTKRVRALDPAAASDGLVTPEGKDKEPEPSVVTNAFGSGKTAFFAFSLGASATPANAAATEQLVRSALRHVTPTKEIHIPDGRTAIGIIVKSLVVPLDLAISVDEKVSAGASVVNGLGGIVIPPDRVMWTLSLDANETDTVHYVLGLVDAGEATVTTNAVISYLVRGMYFKHAPFENLELSIVTEKYLSTLLDQAISQLNALDVDDDKGEDEVEDAVKELQEQKSNPPVTKDKIEDALEEVLEIVKGIDEIETDQASLDALRDTLDKIFLIYGRQLSK